MWDFISVVFIKYWLFWSCFSLFQKYFPHTCHFKLPHSVYSKSVWLLPIRCLRRWQCVYLDGRDRLVILSQRSGHARYNISLGHVHTVQHAVMLYGDRNTVVIYLGSRLIYQSKSDTVCHRWTIIQLQTWDAAQYSGRTVPSSRQLPGYSGLW